MTGLEAVIIDVWMTGLGVEQFETARLAGRRLLPGDLGFLTDLHRSAEVMAAHGGPRSEAATKPFVRSNVAHWRHYRFGLYVLTDRIDLAVVASCEAGNGAARRVMENVGLVEVEDFRRHKTDWIRYRRPAGLPSPATIIASRDEPGH